MRTELAPRFVALLGAFAAAAAPGCAGARLAAPVPPPPASALADLSEVTVALRTFDATNLSEADVRDGNRPRLAEAFLAYLAGGARYARVLGPSDEPPDGAVELDAALRVHEATSRTIVLDGLFFYPFLGTFPFTPEWGQATVEAALRFRAPAEPPIEVRAVAPYSVLFYAWYRTEPLEEAYRRAHDAAFRQLSEGLARRLAARAEGRRRAEEARSARATATATATVATAATATVAVANAEPLAPELLPDAPELLPDAAREPPPAERTPPTLVRLPPDGVGVIAEPYARGGEPPGALARWLGALGGLEASLTGGLAAVESRARVASTGREELLGSGQARAQGFRLALYQPPDRTGFFFPPAFGFLSQSIDIAGFEQDVPVAELPGTQTIGARASDPVTGAPLDLDQQLPYALRLQAGYVGQGVGLNMVIGTEDFQLFGTVRATVNLAELRSVRVDFNGQRAEQLAFAAFQSGAVGAQLGLSIRPLHLAVRAAVEAAWYAEFDYPDLVDAQGQSHRPEFEAPGRYNPETHMNERERVFVEGVSLRTLDWVLSAVVLF